MKLGVADGPKQTFFQISERVFLIEKRLRRIRSLAVQIQTRKDQLSLESILKRFSA